MKAEAMQWASECLFDLKGHKQIYSAYEYKSKSCKHVHSANTRALASGWRYCQVSAVICLVVTSIPYRSGLLMSGLANLVKCVLYSVHIQSSGNAEWTVISHFVLVMHTQHRWSHLTPV